MQGELARYRRITARPLQRYREARGRAASLPLHIHATTGDVFADCEKGDTSTNCGRKCGRSFMM